MKIKKPNVKLAKPQIKLNKETITKNISVPKVNFRKVLKLTKRELLNYFSSPLAFIILGLFILVVVIILFGVYQYLQFGTNDLTQMFTAIAFAFIIIIPALTMGSISKEKQSGTLEFVLTQPITEFEYLLGKFLTNAVVLFISLILTIPLVFVVGTLAPLDFGQIIMQYKGAFILGLCFISIGTAVSSIFKSEIASLLVSIAISLLFIITGSQLLNFFPLQLQALIERLSLLSHYQSMSRGVLDLRDILYFIAFIGAFFGIAFYALSRNKYPEKHQELRRTKITLVIILVLSILIGALGQIIPGRIDFTSNQKYTLSNESKALIDSIDGNVDIKFYASSNLPTDFQSIKRDVEDILRDYSTTSGGKINVSTYDPQSDSSAKDNAVSEGLQELVFAVDSDDATQRVTGYLGVTFKHNDTSEFLNVTNAVTQDLEYQISRRIKKVSNENKIKVGFLANNVSQSLISTYTIFNSQIRDLYDVVDINITDGNIEIPDDVKVIIIAGPSTQLEETVESTLQNYFEDGGSIILLSDTIQISNETGAPTPNEASLKDFFADYGVTIDENLVYDLQQNNLIGINSGSFTIPVEYPLWFIANATESANSIMKNVSNLSILWGSSITVDEEKSQGTSIYRLFETTSQSNTLAGENIQISVDQNLQPKDGDSSKLVAVGLENEKGGRAIVTGDSDFLSDEIINELTNRREGYDVLNISFGVGSVEWTVKDNQLSTIIARNRLPSRLVIADRERALLIGVGAVTPLVLIGAAGLFALYRRKKIMSKVYEA